MRYPLIALLAFLLAPSPAPASEMLLIKYDLSGVLTLDLFGLINPVYSSAAPGPGGVGSTVTFRFTPELSGGTSVDMLSFAQSHGMTFAHYFTGHLRQTLLSPIAGGALLSKTAGGTGTGLANLYGSAHCLTYAAVCSLFFDRTILSSPFGQNRPGVPAYFAGATSHGSAGAGWVFNSNMSTLRADRPTAVGPLSRHPAVASLVGTEIGRTVIPMPEPGVLQLLAPFLLLVLIRYRLSV